MVLETRLWTRCCCLLAVVLLAPQLVLAETHFLEAESFKPSASGWQAVSPNEVRQASRATTMWGADGPGDAVATKTVTILKAGKFRVWVRWMQVAAWRGPFRVSATTAGREIAAKVFDLDVLPEVADWTFAWQSLEAELPAGEVLLTLAKHEQKNCVGYVRHVDCLLLTTDFELKPNHVAFGPQTFLRVTVGDGYKRPVYLHLFADHYRDPWYGHHAIGEQGVRDELALPADQMLKAGEQSPWSNISHIVYQDSGASLNASLRHSYHEKAPRLKAKLEFGRSRDSAPPGDQTASASPAGSGAPPTVELIKTFDVDANPNGLVVIVPPNLESPENIARLRRDRDFADETGSLADAFAWPTIGKRPSRMPVLVSASIGGYDLPVDAAVQERERKTLSNFGFNGDHSRTLHGLWMMKENSYCRPDVDGMRARVKHEVEVFHKSGRKLDDIAYCMLMDEPTGQPASFMAKDDGYRDRFREWLKGLGLSPQELLEPDWDAVRPVVESDRARHPALHYYTQRFRTVALGDFLAIQKKIIEGAYGRAFPTNVNFSDGAVYNANFCSQGVDYFELLNRDDMNAIWGEDWSNNASTYQCAGFNVDLMRAAGRKRGQTIGHYLIAYGRTPWDNKLKATSETARGVRQWMNFAYGPSWGSHEGGPAWKSSLWYSKPKEWTANAEIPREIGAVEDWLLTAKPTPTEVAILYSSSSDIWTMDNFSYGFDRMHTWLALTHAQTPVNIVPEHEVAEGQLEKYRVCYLSGPNLTRAAAEKLKAWVVAGGTLWLTAGAASRDEFNRPLDTLTTLLPAERGELKAHEPFQNAGLFLYHLQTRDTVTWDNERLEVLSVQQPLTARSNARTLATFGNGQPAVVMAPAGQGQIISLGFLPALSYIKPALTARVGLERRADSERQAASKLAAARAATENADQPLATSAAVSAPNSPTATDSAENTLLNRSRSPWQYPAGIRERLLTPVRTANVSPRLTCDAPLVDVVYLPCEQGGLIALANHTLSPIPQLNLRVKVTRRVLRVESVHRGSLSFKQITAGEIETTLPLESSDWIKLTFE